MSPLPKKAILSISAYKPNFGVAKIKTQIRLSANENPLGCSPNINKNLKLQDLNRYPPQNCENLIKTISSIHNINKKQIILSNGSDELISIISQAYLNPGDEAIYTEFGFLQFPQSISVSGGTGKIAKDKNFRANVDNIIKLVSKKTRVIFLANANNPTGTFINRDEVYRLIENIPKHILIVYDAAYAEYIRDETYVDGKELVKKFENVIMLRTFSKLHGLAALRLGWGYSSEKIVNYLMTVRGPFSVNSVAIQAGIIAMEDLNFQDYCFNYNLESMKWIENELNKINVFFQKSSANFFLMKLDKQNKSSAIELQKFFSSKGILVRNMNVYNLPEYIRVSLGTKVENRYFIEVLKKFISR